VPGNGQVQADVRGDDRPDAAAWLRAHYAAVRGSAGMPRRHRMLMGDGGAYGDSDPAAEPVPAGHASTPVEHRSGRV
jgi:hypothetical protein